MKKWRPRATDTCYTCLKNRTQAVASSHTRNYQHSEGPEAHSLRAFSISPSAARFGRQRGETDYPMVTSTVTFAPLGAMGRTLPVMGLPSTVTEATPFWTALGFLTVMS